MYFNSPFKTQLQIFHFLEILSIIEDLNKVITALMLVSLRSYCNLLWILS
jgi:hypothetical protein